MEILLWGYPSGMRGARHNHYLANISAISTATTARKSWPDYYETLNNLRNLGFLTISKLAYFYSHHFENTPSLILDQQLINVLRSGIGRISLKTVQFYEIGHAVFFWNGILKSAKTTGGSERSKL